MLDFEISNLDLVPRRTINHYAEHPNYIEVIQPTTSNVVFLTNYHSLIWKHFELVDWNSLREFIESFSEKNSKVPEKEAIKLVQNLIDLGLIELVNKEGW